MYLLLQIYIITVIFSMLVITYFARLVETNQDIQNKAFMLIKSELKNIDFRYKRPMYEIFIPVVNVFIGITLLWLIFADEETVKKFMEDKDEH